MPASRLSDSSTTSLALYGLNGWRWMTYDELRQLQATAKRSYIVRPYYARSGELDYILTPEGGSLSIATAAIRRAIPFPRDLLPYPAHSSRTTKGVIMTANRALPALVPKYVSIGTAAVIDSGQALPAVDLLPEPMRWENPLHVDHPRVLPGLRRTFGRPRNLPSGTPLRPVVLAKRDQDYFEPLAADPAEARDALSPALLNLTRDLRVAWWSEGTVLFVWVHDDLLFPDRERLAERAEQIHRHLVR